MYMTMLGMAAFMDWFGKVRTAEGIMWFGIGAIVGWPFAVVLVVPFLFEEVVFAMLDKTALEEAAWRVVDGVVRSSIALVSLLVQKSNIIAFFISAQQLTILYYTGSGCRGRPLLLPSGRIRAI